MKSRESGKKGVNNKVLLTDGGGGSGRLIFTTQEGMLAHKRCNVPLWRF